MEKSKNVFQPRLIAWEITKKCNLKCIHCRADSKYNNFKDELSTEECFKILDNISSFSNPIIILTGGEPLFRKDIYKIIQYGKKIGLKIALATCGYLLDKKTALKLKKSGIERISLSIDGKDNITHDNFRQIKGSFDTVINAAKTLNEINFPFQVNTTITKLNYNQIEEILNLAVNIGAVAFHPFLLVPTGRAKNLKQFEISPKDYEKILKKIYQMSKLSSIQFKPTCAPHYYRILLQKEKQITKNTDKMHMMTKGCLGGQSFAFISNTGKIQICGFLEKEAGDLRKENYNFKNIWEHSKLFNLLRDTKNYKGKCGYCEYINVCGGCRARAFSITGNFLDEEPYCIYQPKKIMDNKNAYNKKK